MDFSRWCEDHRASVDTCLQSRFSDAWPPRFKEASLYPLQTGGKRIRPLFAIAAAEALNAPISNSTVQVAASVELIHTYSLVHDDMPCMDNDDMRRGKPAVHVAYGEPEALLVGDALLTEAFRILTVTDLKPEVQVRLIADLAEGAGHVGMIGGQAADIGMGGPVDDAETLMKLHNGKTGALIRTSVRMGAIAAGASSTELQQLSQYGAAIGLAFQMADDILDKDEDAGDDGPPSYVKLLGEAETRRKAEALLNEALAVCSSFSAAGRLVELARFTVERDY